MDEIKGIDNVAEGFAHFSPMSIPDHCMEVHLSEGDFPQKLLSKEDHPCNPEEQDIMASLKEVVWVEILQI